MEEQLSQKIQEVLNDPAQMAQVLELAKSLGVTLPPLLFAIGIPHTGLGLAGILTTSELVIAMLSAHFVLGEAVSPLAWLGIALIFGGILVGNRVSAPQKKSRADLHEACEMRYN